MSRVWQLLVRADGDTKSAQKELRKLERGTQQFGKKMAGVGRNLTLGLTAPIVAFGVLGVKGLADAERASAQTAAALKSTGNTARTSVKGIESMAMSLRRMSGVDDELIQKGANVLLTFTKIRNEGGKAGGTFDRATKAALDMSVALGTDMTAASMLVGKALNDPVKGMAALRRAGVQLTKQQEDQIKTMVESGDVTGAQTVLLKELETQFGGSAKAAGGTFAGQMSRARLAVEEMAEAVMRQAMPMLTQVTGWIARMAERFGSLSPQMQKLVGGFLLVAAAIGPVLWALGTLISVTAPLTAALGLSLGAVLAIPLALIALGAALVIAYKKSETFRNIVNAAFSSVRTSVTQVLAALRSTLTQWVQWGRTLWTKFGADIMGVLGPVFAIARTMISTQLANIRDAIRVVLALLRGDWSSAWSVLKDIVGRTLRATWTIIRNSVGGALSALRSIATGILTLRSTFAGWGEQLGRALMDGIINHIRNNAASLAESVAAALTGPVGGAVKDVADAARGAARSGKGVKGPISTKALQQARQQAKIDANAQLSYNQALRQYNAGVAALALARKSKDAKKIAAAQQALARLAQNLVHKEREKNEAAAEKVRLDRAAVAEAEENAARAAEKAEAAAEQQARDQHDAENFRRRALGLMSIEEEVELAAANTIRAQHGLAPVSRMSEIGNPGASPSGGALGGGGMSAGDSGAGFNGLMPSSVSASGAVQSAAMRALGGITINGAADPETVARRVAFILGGSRLRMGGAF